MILCRLSRRRRRRRRRRRKKERKKAEAMAKLLLQKRGASFQRNCFAPTTKHLCPMFHTNQSNQIRSDQITEGSSKEKEKGSAGKSLGKMQRETVIWLGPLTYISLIHSFKVPMASPSFSQPLFHLFFAITTMMRTPMFAHRRKRAVAIGGM
jgi:hypothetical protein